MKYKCTEGFSVEICDDDGFSTDDYMEIEQGSIWDFIEDSWRLVGGEVRLESNAGWIEVSQETFQKNFIECLSIEELNNSMGIQGIEVTMKYIDKSKDCV